MLIELRLKNGMRIFVAASQIAFFEEIKGGGVRMTLVGGRTEELEGEYDDLKKIFMPPSNPKIAVPQPQIRLSR